MECVQIKKYLSEYVDETLEPETDAIVKEHLSHCKGCRKDFDSLKVLIQELQNLERVKAPNDFLEQFHSRISKRHAPRQLVKNSLIPFRMKIPIRFASVIATATLIFIIMHTPTIKKEIQAPPPSGKIYRGVADGTDTKDITSKSSRVHRLYPDATLGEKATKIPPKKVPQPTIKEFRTIPKTPQSEKATYPLDIVPLKAESESSSLKSEKSADITLVLNLIQPKNISKAPAGHGLRLKQSLDQGALKKKGSISKGKTSTQTPSRDTEKHSFELDEVISNPAKETLEEPPKTVASAPDEILSTVIELVERIKGRIISTTHNKDSGLLESLEVNIPAEQYELLHQGLTPLGTLQSLSPINQTTVNKSIFIRIRFVQAGQ